MDDNERVCLCKFQRQSLTIYVVWTFTHTPHELQNELESSVETEQRPWPRGKFVFDLCDVIRDLEVGHWLDGDVVSAIRSIQMALQHVDFLLKVFGNKSEKPTSKSEEPVQLVIGLQVIPQDQLIAALSAFHEPLVNNI